MVPVFINTSTTLVNVHDYIYYYYLSTDTYPCVKGICFYSADSLKSAVVLDPKPVETNT